ncbi:MAG: Ig-like domain-containing protein, partial [bacterium]
EMAFHPGGWYAYLGFDDTDCPKVCALDTEAASATYLELIAGAVVDLYGGMPAQRPVSLDFTPSGDRCLVLTRRCVGDPTRAAAMLDSEDPRNPTLSKALDLGGTASAVEEHIEISPRGDRAIAGVHEAGLFNLEIRTAPDSLILIQQGIGAAQSLGAEGLEYAADASKFYCLSEAADTLCVYDFSGAQTVAVYAGDGQTGVVNAPLTQPLRAKVTDGSGTGVSGVPVEFAVTSGGGRFSAGDSVAQVVTTDAGGIAEATWTLGPDLGAGAHTAQASATGLAGSPLSFTATGVADPMTLALTVVSVTPDSGTTGVDIATATQTVFSRPVDVTTVTPSTFYIHDGDFQALPAVFGFADDNRKISLTPKVSLEPSTTYWIEATAGIKDGSGGPLEEAAASSFTTEQAAATELGSAAPASAVVGAYVVLSGKGFNKQASLNKVLFDTTGAYVSAGCTDFLTVAVPLGAQTGPVRVINTAAADTSGDVIFTVLPPDMSYANDVLGSVTTSSATRSVGITPDGAVAFAVSPDADKVGVIDLASLTNITSVAIGDNPIAVTLDRAGDFAYVANHLDGTVSVICADPQSPAYCDVVDVLSVGVGPTDLVVTPDGDRLIVANASSGTVSVVDADSTSETYRRVVTSIAVGSGSRTVAVTPDGELLYVGTDSGYIVISATDYGVVTSIAVGSGSRTVSITPDGAFLVVLTTDGVVDIYDIQPGSAWENQVVTSIAVGAGATTVAISPDGGFIYLIEEVGDTILMGVISIFNQFGVIADGQESSWSGIEVTLVDTLAVGEDPADIAFDPTGSGRVIVTTAGDCKLTVLGDPSAGVGPTEPPQVLRNFPNPFSQTTTVRFAVAERSHVTLAIYDVTGRLVRT